MTGQGNEDAVERHCAGALDPADHPSAQVELDRAAVLREQTFRIRQLLVCLVERRHPHVGIHAAGFKPRF
jgi:hypothetical protein